MNGPTIAGGLLGMEKRKAKPPDRRLIGGGQERWKKEKKWALAAGLRCVAARLAARFSGAHLQHFAKMAEHRVNR